MRLAFATSDRWGLSHLYKRLDGLSPSVSLSYEVKSRHRSWRKTSFSCEKRFIGTFTARNRGDEDGFRPIEQEGPLVRDICSLEKTEQRKDPKAWLKFVDKYFPDRPASEFHDVQISRKVSPTTDLVELLSKGKTNTGHNLLVYLAFEQGRWETMVSLIERLVQRLADVGYEATNTRKFPVMVYSGGRHSLDVITEKPFDFSGTCLARPSVKHSKSSMDADLFLSAQDDTGFHDALGEVWRILSHLILKAEALPKTDQLHVWSTSVYMYVLGQMHHLNLIPYSLYNYDTSYSGKPFARPPTIYILSRRIMSSLSDLAWKWHWRQERERALSYGYQLPAPRVEPKLLTIGPEIWLELVLWACVEGGHFDVAGEILQQLEPGALQKNPPKTHKARREETKVRAEGKTEAKEWRVISWKELCSRSQSETRLAALIKTQLNKSRLNQMTGIQIANSGDYNVEPESRTISREVVLAVMDGLANDLYDHQRGSVRGPDSVSRFYNQLQACKTLLKRTSNSVTGEDLMSIVFRGLEPSLFPDPEGRKSRSLWVSELTSVILNNSELSAATGREIPELDLRSPLLGLSYWELEDSAIKSQFVPALRILKRIQRWIDDCRDEHFETYRQKVVDQNDRGAGPGMNDSADLKISAHLPVSTVNALLDLIADSKNHELGEWFVFNDDIDGGLLSPEAYEMPQLYSAFLRFADATGNEVLEGRIMERMLDTQEPEVHLRELTQYEIRRGHWRRAGNLLGHMSQLPDYPWTAAIAMQLAAAVLEESKAQRDTNSVVRLLQELIHGEHDPRRWLAADPQRRQLVTQTQNQLARIFQSVDNSFLQQISARIEPGRLYSPAPIAPEDFKILLDSVVRCSGISAGIKLCKRWVISTDDEVPAPSRRTDSAGVVEPTLSLLRSILQPLIWERNTARRRPRGASDVVDATENLAWAWQQYRRLHPGDSEMRWRSGRGGEADGDSASKRSRERDEINVGRAVTDLVEQGYAEYLPGGQL